MRSQEIQNWAEPLLIKTFGLTRRVREGSERLDRWLSATINLTTFEEESLQRLLRSAIQNLDGWNGRELSMKPESDAGSGKKSSPASSDFPSKASRGVSGKATTGRVNL